MFAENAQRTVDVESLAQQGMPVLAGLKPTDQCELSKITTGSSKTCVLDPEPTGLLQDTLEGRLYQLWCKASTKMFSNGMFS